MQFKCMQMGPGQMGIILISQISSNLLIDNLFDSFFGCMLLFWVPMFFLFLCCPSFMKLFSDIYIKECDDCEINYKGLYPTLIYMMKWFEFFWQQKILLSLIKCQNCSENFELLLNIKLFEYCRYKINQIHILLKPSLNPI